MEKLIDRYWRRARREDAIREVPLLARFRDCESAGWTELPLYLIGYCLKPRIDWAHLNGEWLDTDGDGWAYCEVYDAPDPGEGWRLIDVDKETPKEGDQYFVHPSQWIDRADCHGCFKDDKFYRRRIEQPMIDVLYWEVLV